MKNLSNSKVRVSKIYFDIVINGDIKKIKCAVKHFSNDLPTIQTVLEYLNRRRIKNKSKISYISINMEYSSKVNKYYCAHTHIHRSFHVIWDRKEKKLVQGKPKRPGPFWESTVGTVTSQQF